MSVSGLTHNQLCVKMCDKGLPQRRVQQEVGTSGKGGNPSVSLSPVGKTGHQSHRRNPPQEQSNIKKNLTCEQTGPEERYHFY